MAARHLYASGETLTAANKNLDPSGAVAAPGQATTNQGSITTVVDVTSATITFTAISGYRYRISGQGLFSSTVSGDNASLTITDGSNTVLQTANLIVSTAGTQTITSSVVVTPSAGSVTYKLRASRVSGTGVLTLTAGSTAPAFVDVEDIGST